MEALLAGLEATTVAQTLRTSRWLYAATNAAHIFGIALLVGAIVPAEPASAWLVAGRPA